ncbi:NucA/NucB deoxyribonuclease domain-containing protein [Paenibacillus sp. S150]|uniref:NucA/NucB deoxyribonuclease domain-containing protein n=1 Tax=Paenibacillus sp. S150 TaxID=2749826 RepID=UPI001C5A24DD|nr:NucA/NucB deoxyribonuclease domain-containing protein [Paenibacillus sp. S150]MBW4080038.1 DNA-entry nuclease [Paenibacillus sp. S150]
MKSKKFLPSLIISVLLLVAAYWLEENGGLPGTRPSTGDTGIVRLEFPSDRFPETAGHIKEAIRSGESAVCTINRQLADENRKESLRGVPTKKGYDRDEWPMAMCEEGGRGADIQYITPSDNRGAGSWVGNQLEELPDGTRVEFMFK